MFLQQRADGVRRKLHQGDVEITQIGGVGISHHERADRILVAAVDRARLQRADPVMDADLDKTFVEARFLRSCEVITASPSIAAVHAPK